MVLNLLDQAFVNDLVTTVHGFGLSTWLVKPIDVIHRQYLGWFEQDTRYLFWTWKDFDSIKSPVISQKIHICQKKFWYFTFQGKCWK